MKTKFRLLALIPGLVFSSGCGGSKMVNVIILSGQSNAAGCKASENLLKSMPEKYEEYKEGYEDIKIAYNNWTITDFYNKARPKALQSSSLKSEFVKVQLGQGNVSTNFGPEVGMAEELHSKWGGKLFIIKIPCGGSNLNDDWALETDEMFVTMLNFVEAKFKDLQKQGLTPYLRAFCWMQGEGDSYDGYYQYYLDNLIQFKKHLDRNLLKYTENNVLPFVDAGIGSGEGEWKYFEEINKQKEEFAAMSPTNVYFDTVSQGIHSNLEKPDNMHYDSESIIKLGHLFAQAYEQFLK